MLLYPAIDILEGKAVRLVRGDFDAKKVYDQDPLDAARRFVEEGAQQLHVVDLDGARTGEPRNLDHLRRISDELGVRVQYGGGLRSPDAVAQALRAGANRIILGTAAFTDETLLEDSLARFAGQVLVSVDLRSGRVTTAGWTLTTELTPEAVLAGLAERGLAEVVFTNVDRDGMLEGPDLEEVRTAARGFPGKLLYSGGIGELEHLEALRALEQPNLAGVIVGKALYERRFSVPEAIAALA